MKIWLLVEFPDATNIREVQEEALLVIENGKLYGIVNCALLKIQLVKSLAEATQP